MQDRDRRRIAFYAPQGSDGSTVKVYEFSDGDGNTIYATEEGGPPGWKKGAAAFDAYASETEDTIALVSGVLKGPGGNRYVTAPQEVFSNADTAEVLSREAFHVVAADKSRWMERNEAIHSKKLRHICLPCTHDAATANLQDVLTTSYGDVIGSLANGMKRVGDALAKTGIGYAIDIPKWVADNTFDTAKRVSRAQLQPIRLQLEGGIRGLDLRPYYHADTDEFYMYHGVLGEKVSTVLGEIRGFLASRPGEIVYVTFSHIKHADTPALQDRLTDMIRTALGPYAYLRDATNEEELFDQTYTQIIGQGESGSKAIIVYSESTDPMFWPAIYEAQKDSSVIIGRYSETSDVKKMLERQKENYERAKKADLPFSLFMTLTPDDEEVYKLLAGDLAGPLAVVGAPGFFAGPVGWAVMFAAESLATGFAIAGARAEYRSLFQLVTRVNPMVTAFVYGQFVPATGPNLISLLWVDFYESSRAVDVAIELSNRG